MEARRVATLWHRLDVTVRDLPAGLLLLAASFTPALHNQGTQLGGVPDRAFDALAVVAAVLESLPLAVRRRWPSATLVLVSVGFALDQLRGYHMFAGTGLAIAVLSTGAHLRQHRRVTALLASVAYVALAVALYRLGVGETPVEFATFYLALVFAWGIGAWLRSTRAAEAEHRRQVAEATRTAERTRIARELHDVVTHHVTAMVVQAEAARYLTASPDRLDETLSAVTDTGRRAISDLRHLLDLLNPDHETDAEPPDSDLRSLVEQSRRAGQSVEFTEIGTSAPSAGSAEFVTYRVVQEALTNALKYAHGGRTVVRVSNGDKEITVEISTDDSGSPTGVVGGSGRGLAGLRDRVNALGGEFGAGRRADGGFVVRASIPTGGPS